MYELEIIDSTFEALQKDGYILTDELYFPNGILIQIEDTPIQKDSTFTFNASKWRSGLGAIGYNNASITYNNDTWNITTQGSWVS